MRRTQNNSSSLSIRHWQDPLDPTGVAVVFDIFRCSTTIHSLLKAGASPLWVAPSLGALQESAEPEFIKNLQIFSELKTEIDCGERYDNSPKLALERGKKSDALVATTTGTPAMFAAQNYAKVYVGSMVSFSALIRELSALTVPITLIPAAFKDSGHVEDQIAAQAVATALDGYADMPEFVRGCAEHAKEQMIASGRPSQLAQKLSTGEDDTRISMDIDRFNFVPTIEFRSNFLGKIIL